MSVSAKPTARVAVLAIASLMWISCMGDPGYSVTIYNQTGKPVTVVESGIGLVDNRSLTTRLEPGDKKTSHWLAPDGSADPRRAVVRATDDAGAQIFCRMLSFDDVKGNFAWRVDVVAGINNCK